MKHIIKNMVTAAAEKAVEAGRLPSAHLPDMEIEAPKHESQGDLSTNFAMVSAAVQKMAPRQIAQILIDHMEPMDWIEKIEVAGPGFVNFFLKPAAWHPVVNQVLEADDK
jgi:arginyl-tRNA synthetase